MSTRSIIIRKNEEGKYESIYCHWDGYPTCNGVILYNHYNNPERVKKLISLGDLSSLNVFIEPDNRAEEKHTFDNPQPNTCVFYGRDRGEDINVDFRTFDNLLEVLKQDCWQEYAYVYEDGVWYMWDYRFDLPSGVNIIDLEVLSYVLEQEKDNIKIRQ